MQKCRLIFVAFFDFLERFYLFDKERASRGSGREREREKQTPR